MEQGSTRRYRTKEEALKAIQRRTRGLYLVMVSNHGILSEGTIPSTKYRIAFEGTHLHTRTVAVSVPASIVQVHTRVANIATLETEKA